MHGTMSLKFSVRHRLQTDAGSYAFPRVKWSGRVSLSSAVVKNAVELYLHPPNVLMLRC